MPLNNKNHKANRNSEQRGGTNNHSTEEIETLFVPRWQSAASTMQSWYLTPDPYPSIFTSQDTSSIS